jgi:hypothetical protein
MRSPDRPVAAAIEPFILYGDATRIGNRVIVTVRSDLAPPPGRYAGAWVEYDRACPGGPVEYDQACPGGPGWDWSAALFVPQPPDLYSDLPQTGIEVTTFGANRPEAGRVVLLFAGWMPWSGPEDPDEVAATVGSLVGALRGALGYCHRPT